MEEERKELMGARCKGYWLASSPGKKRGCSQYLSELIVLLLQSSNRHLASLLLTIFMQINTLNRATFRLQTAKVGRKSAARCTRKVRFPNGERL